MRNFKLIGNVAAKFAQLEKILPRIMSRMNTKTYGIIPDSILSTYKSQLDEDNIILRCGMFAGKIKKILFQIRLLEGKKTPKYVCTISNGSEMRVIEVETKKMSHILEVNVDVDDGAMIEITQVNNEVKLFDIYITALVSLKQSQSETIEYITDKLLKDVSLED